MRKHIFTLGILLLLSVYGRAQFTVTESFKGSSVGSNIITGGSAILTSGNADPVNDGWLRLTPSTGNQKGYAYVNSSFPSTMGVIMEFEYKTWRSANDTYNGADGFCVFLFDAATTTFATGGYGGSLGYAPNTSGSVTTGLSGGYLGVGFDEYGNFSSASEGRIGGIGVKCNSITMRGPTTSNSTTTNRYLTSVQEQTVASNNANSIDWNNVTTTRPTDATFFRKVKISILPTGTGSYVITVYWQTTTSGSYTQLLQYTTTDVPPANLKLGFAASTGGGFNFHEIRNLYITTLGNVRVQKDVDKANANVGDQVTYTVNVTNDNTTTLSGVALADTLKNSVGSFLTLGTDFNINSITFNNNGNAATTATGFTSGTAKTTGFTNPWNTTLNIAASSAATFTIVGKVVTQPTGNVVKNFVGIDPTSSGITDQDLTNNYANVTTTILNPNIDFTISKTVNSSCADATNGNTYSIVVSNMGATASVAGNQVTVTDVVPAGFTVQSTPSGTGWTVSNSGNTYTFKRSDALASAYAYPTITIKALPPSTTGTSWVNTATVAYAGTETNTTNNSSSVTLYGLPTLVITNPAAVCSPGTVDLTAAAVTAGSSSNQTYSYYTDAACTSVLSHPEAVTTSGTYYILGTSTVSGCTSAIKPVVVTINYTLSGAVFNDHNGLNDNTVNGTGTNGTGMLSVVIYNNTTSKVENVVSVATDGTYSSCSSAKGNNYTLYLTTSTATVGQATRPALTLPTLGFYTGEHIGTGAGSDGTVDGTVTTGAITGNVSNIDFGIKFHSTCLISNKNVTDVLK